MSLTPEQKQAVASWVAAGDNLSAVQKKLTEQFYGQISYSYSQAKYTALDGVSRVGCFDVPHLVSITGGAVLTNYMDGYVASIHRAGAPLWATVFFGWQPWGISRVAAFCILGVVLADPLLSRVLRYPAQPWKKLRPWVLVAATHILVDWTLKAALAPTWGRVLNSAIPVNLPPAFPESPHQGHH